MVEEFGMAVVLRGYAAMVTLSLQHYQAILEKLYTNSETPCNTHPSSGVFWYKYYMRLLCYDSYTTDPDVMDQLLYCAHSYSVQPLGIRWLIREDRLSLALLADCELVPRPTLDWIA